MILQRILSMDKALIAPATSAANAFVKPHAIRQSVLIHLRARVIMRDGGW